MSRFVLLLSNAMLLQSVSRLRKKAGASGNFEISARLPKGIGVAFNEEGKMVVFTRVITLRENVPPEKAAKAYEPDDKIIVGTANQADNWLIISTEGQLQPGMGAHLQPARDLILKSIDKSVSEIRNVLIKIDMPELIRNSRKH